MKIYLNENDYITDEGTGHNGKKCKLDYIWIGPEEGPCIGHLSDGKLRKLHKMVEQALALREKSKNGINK